MRCNKRSLIDDLYAFLNFLYKEKLLDLQILSMTFFLVFDFFTIIIMYNRYI